MITIYNMDVLKALKQMPDKSVDMQICSPPYWGLRDYGEGTESIWDGDEDCEHEWIIGKAAGDTRISKRSESRAGWKRPSREEFANRTVTNICPICNDEFEGKPGQKFCSIKCLNTLSNEQRTSTPQVSNFCQKCGAWKGQLGLEPDFDLFIKHLCDIFDEVKRVLKKDGTCWVNLGDTYHGGNLGVGVPMDYKSISFTEGDGQGFKSDDMESFVKQRNKMNYKSKCLCAIPERFMIEMINRGWILRNKIIWHKPNHMPTSVKDRFATSWEYLFFFSKSKKYFFDLDAVREPHKAISIERTKHPWDGVRPEGTSWSGMDITKMCNPKGKNPDDVVDYGSYGDLKTETEHRQCFNKLRDSKDFQHPLGKNPSDFWDITTRGYKEAHFAVFPETLVKRPIKTTKKDAVIMDIFVGSGTTLKVARDLKRDSIGIEIKKEYCDLIYKRLFAGSHTLFPDEFKLIK